jgi:hypothetical protein
VADDLVVHEVERRRAVLLAGMQVHDPGAGVDRALGLGGDLVGEVRHGRRLGA